MKETKSVQIPVDLHKRIATLRIMAKGKMNLDDGVFVNMSGVIAVAIAMLEKEWKVNE